MEKSNIDKFYDENGCTNDLADKVISIIDETDDPLSNEVIASISRETGVDSSDVHRFVKGHCEGTIKEILSLYRSSCFPDPKLWHSKMLVPKFIEMRKQQAERWNYVKQGREELQKQLDFAKAEGEMKVVKHLEAALKALQL